jgi:hypothetical protein
MGWRTGDAMKLNVVRFVVLLAALLLACPVRVSAAPSEKVLSKGSLDGTCVGLEQGDYAHLLIKDKKGKTQSFFILRGDATVDKFVAHPERYTGRRIRIKWREIIKTIPEAGGKMKIKEVVSILLLK